MKGVNYRETRGMPYVRREYIAGKPQIKIARFSSGQASNNYDYKLELLATEKIQIRHNALEAAREKESTTTETEISTPREYGPGTKFSRSCSQPRGAAPTSPFFQRILRCLFRSTRF